MESSTLKDAMEAKRELTRIREKLQAQIRILQAEMDAIDKALQLVHRESTGNSATTQDRRFAKKGLSDAIRAVVAAEYLSPSEIRDAMVAGGYKTDSKTKLLGSVFATCKRMEKGGHLDSKRLDGKLKYRKSQTPTLVSDASAVA